MSFYRQVPITGLLILLFAAVSGPMHLQAQQSCTITATATPNPVCPGEPVTLDAVGLVQVAFESTFNGGSIPVGWNTTSQATVTSTLCPPSYDGSNYLWMGDAAAHPRIIETIDFDLTTGGTVSFAMRFAIQGQGSPCEGIDLNNEGVYFQYSTNGGGTWTTIEYYPPTNGGFPTGGLDMTEWNLFTHTVPPGGQTANTRFRWAQLASSNNNFDHWGIDEVNILVNSNVAPPDYVWQPGNLIGPTQTVNPTSNTNYTVTVTVGGITCSDDTLVEVHPPDFPDVDILPASPTVCEGETINLNANSVDGGDDPFYQWSVNGTVIGSGLNPAVTVPDTFPVGTHEVVLLMVSDALCPDTNQVSDTVQLEVTPGNPMDVTLAAAPPTTICPGEVVNFSATPTNGGTTPQYQWLIDGAPSGPVSGSPTFASPNSLAPGTYDVSVELTSSATCVSGNPDTSNVVQMVVQSYPTITGPDTLCGGQTATYTTAQPGNWSLVSGIGSSQTNGTVTFANPGAPAQDSLFYTNSTGCSDTLVITVNPSPTLSGPTDICQNLSDQFTGAPAGGTYSLVSSVGSSIDPVSGLATAGTPPVTTLDSVFYIAVGGCKDTLTYNAQPQPAINGPTDVCSEFPATYTSSLAGTWSIVSAVGSNIGPGGAYQAGTNTGTAAEVDTLFHTSAVGCQDTFLVNVQPAPVISGPSANCAGDTVVYSAQLTGTWSIVSAVGSSVDPVSGEVAFASTALTGQTDSLFFTSAEGCADTLIIDVLPKPEITGATEVCSGSQTAYTTGFGGNWSLSTNVGSGIDPLSGIYTAGPLNTGTATDSLFFTSGSNCTDTFLVTVNPKPEISGPTALCGTDTATYSASTAGTWSIVSSVGSTVDPAGFVQFGNNNSAVASDSIFFNTAAGCSDTFVVTLNPTPEITGPTDGCGLGSTTLSSSFTGSWSLVSSIGSTIDGTGSVVFGNNPGSAVTDSAIVTTAFGCVDTHLITVNAKPVIAGPAALCGTDTATYSASTAGTWSIVSSVGSTVDPAGFVQFGNNNSAVASDSIFFNTAAGCSDTFVVTLNPTPEITGPTDGCGLGSTTLSSSFTGSWSLVSSIGSTIDGTGNVVFGNNPGTAVTDSAFVTTAFGCVDTHLITVNAKPVITGVSFICGTETATYTASIGGGTWSIGSGIGSTVDGATGQVTFGNDDSQARTDSLLYATAAGCTDTLLITVNPVPSISGPAEVCPGIPTAYTSSTGEDWSLVTAHNSSLSNSGQTATYTARNPGNTPGLSDSIYVSTTPGCQSGIAVSIRQAPEITGDAELCAGESTSYQASLGGSWALLPTTSGSFVDTATGDFTAGAVSSTTFDSLLFTAQNTCRDTFGVTVHPLPSFSIDAPATACFEATLAVPQDPAVEVMWSTGEMTPTITVTESGTYDAQRTNTSTGCQFSATHTVTIEAPEAAFTVEDPGEQPVYLVPEAFVQFRNSSTDANSYAWFFGDGNTSDLTEPRHEYTEPGTYEPYLVAFSPVLQCPDTAYGEPLVVEGERLRIINVFTPNGDGINDQLTIVGNENNSISSFTCWIFDRTGTRVATVRGGGGDGWDGRTDNGEDALEGVYTAVIEAETWNGYVIKRTVQITLLR